MNILYVLKYFPVFGGGETVTLNLCNELVNRSNNVYIVYFENTSNKSDVLPFIDSRIKTICLSKDRNKSREKMHELLENESIDVIVNQWGGLYTKLCNSARNGTKAKLIVCLHIQPLTLRNSTGRDWKSRVIRLIKPIYKYLEYPIHSYRLTRIASLCDRYVFLSDSFVKQFVEYSHFDNSKKKICAISNPVVLKPDMGSCEKRNELLFVGRIQEHHKRISLILKSWRILQDLPEFGSWNLTIVGDGPDLSILKSLAINMGLKRISFEGFKEPDSYYSRSKIFLMTSAYEGFGMTLVESQQYGMVPVVMDSFLSLHDIIINEYNGLIVKNNDLNAYVLSIQKLVSNPVLLSEMSLNARKSVDDFSVHKIVDKWESLFNEML